VQSSTSGTCTPGNAPFFDFGPIDEASCRSDPASKRALVNEIFVAINKLPTRVKPRQPQGTFVQTTGFVLLKGCCILSCDRTHLLYAACPSSDAPGA
jgi:hypothetical protein